MTTNITSVHSDHGPAGDAGFTLHQTNLQVILRFMSPRQHMHVISVIEIQSITLLVHLSSEFFVLSLVSFLVSIPVQWQRWKWMASVTLPRPMWKLMSLSASRVAKRYGTHASLSSLKSCSACLRVWGN